MNFRIGEPINSRIGKKIKSLQRVFAAKEGDDRRKYIELQEATPWIRMQSGVNITDDETAKEYGVAKGYALAQKYVLFGANARISGDSYTPNTPDIVGLPGYERSTAFDIRPKPGITGMSIRSHNRFGSLRTANVRFVCWTKEQIDAIEVLFMRPGYSVLLEWGHSKNLNVDGRSILDLNLGVDLYSMEDTAEGVYKEITKKRLESAYGYDAILGQIKNFSWSLRPDGGYDCVTELVSPGDMIESYKANFFLAQSEIQGALSKQIQNSGLTLRFPDVAKDSVDIPYDLQQLPQVQSLYQNFIRQAEAGLKRAVENYNKLLEDALLAAQGGDTSKRTALFQSVFSSNVQVISTNTEADLKLIGEMLALMQIVKGGQNYGKLKVQRAQQYRAGRADGSLNQATSTVNWNNFAKAAPASPWTDGIADLNVGNNIKDGIPDVTLPDGGYVALIPSSIDKFYELYNKLTIIGVESKEKVAFPLRHIAQALALDTANWKWGTKDPGVWASTSPGTNKPGFGESWKTAWPGTSVTTLRDNPSGDATRNLPADTQMWQATNTDSKVTYTIIEVPKSTDAQFNDGKGWIYDSNRSPATGEIVTTYFDPAQHGDQRLDKPGSSVAIGTLKFLPIRFVGYDINDRSTAENLTATEETLQKAQVTDAYVSKLHFYLRTFVELPYSTNYLQTPTPNEAFNSIFQYRSLDTVEIGNALGQGPTKRKVAPSVVTQGLGNVLGGSFFNEDITIYTDTVYIKLGALLELLNRHVLRSDSEYFFNFVTSYNSGAEPLYFTWADHISADPRVCILPHTVTSTNLNIPGYTGTGTNRILDIELSINFVLDTLNQYISDRGRVNLLDFIQAILDNIVRVTGGVNDLQLQFIEDSYREFQDANGKTEYEIYVSKFHVVDRKVLAPIGRSTFEQNGAKLDLYGLGSIIHDVRLESKLTPQISSMIAISAQASPYTSGEEATGFNAINKNLVDRIYSERYDIEKQANEEEFQEQSFEKGREWLKSQIVGVVENLAYFYEKAATPPNAEEQIGTYENYSKFLLGLSNKFSTNTSQRATYNFIIPFELNLTLRGISGLRVMDAFITSQDILPKTYGGRKNSPVAFLITGVEHSVDMTGWKTNLRTQIYNIDENDPYVDPYKDNNLKKDLEVSATRIFLDSRPGGTGEETGEGRKKPATNPGLKGASGVSNPTSKEAMPAKMIDATPSLFAKWVPIGKGYGAKVSSTPQQARTIGNTTKPHNGIDISAVEGAPVYATAAGVITIQNLTGFGKFGTYIKDSDGWLHVYGHMSGNPENIKSGAKVEIGDVIGYVGNLGRSTGPHLHYEIIDSWAKTKLKDPIKHINSLYTQVPTLFTNAEVF